MGRFFPIAGAYNFHGVREYCCDVRMLTQGKHRIVPMQAPHFIISTGEAIAYGDVILDCRNEAHIADLMPILRRLRRAERSSLIK